MGQILNAKNRKLGDRAGQTPDVSGALRQWFQPMIFETVAKAVVAGFVQEKGTQIKFRGVIQPKTRGLMLKPEGQRAWTWFDLYAESQLVLEVDAIVNYLGVPTRVMGKRDYTIYGYVYYELVQNWQDGV